METQIKTKIANNEFIIQACSNSSHKNLVLSYHVSIILFFLINK